MRLIKIDDLDNLRLSRPMPEADAPPFAILSHTWGDAEDELSFQDMVDLSHHKHKKGFDKILSFCTLAQRSGYEYAWADTVCIDQTSSAELSEAINSMYRWYSTSAVCYVFLHDLSLESSSIFADELRKCRWFTRGWTLQELLGPKDVGFYDKNWNAIGTKRDLRILIHEITGINFRTLAGSSVKRASIARRMSWASKRKTSRPEDRAYSLLGIFGIYMPIIYGEGESAFIRLQEEILRSSDDQSIFAWSVAQPGVAPMCRFWGLLAPSPTYFQESSDYLPVRGMESIADHSVTGRGISLNVPVHLPGNTIILNCHPADGSFLITLPVARLRSGSNEYARLNEPARPGLIPFAIVKDVTKVIPIFVRTNVQEEDFQDEYSIPYLKITRFPSLESGYKVKDYSPAASINISLGTIFTSPFPGTFCGAILRFKHTYKERPSFIVAMFTDSFRGDTDCISQDVIGVFSGVSWKGFHAQFFEWLRPLERGDRALSMKLLPGAVNMLVRDEVQFWKLEDSTFVRVSVQRGVHEDRVGSIAVAEILAGTSWERDILGVKSEGVGVSEAIASEWLVGW